MTREIIHLLKEKSTQYNNPNFIETDPISIPHRFTQKEDREIAGFFAATLAWGQRSTIIRNAATLMQGMGNSPYDFIMSFRETDLDRFSGFAHRTFNFIDLTGFMYGLKSIYQLHGGMEKVFIDGYNKGDMACAIHHFRQVFFQAPHEKRTRKHISDPLAGSSAKRINMFLRWMVRKDNCGVDFGIWEGISPSQLICPLDTHSGRVARKLSLLTRKQDNWIAAFELTESLRQIDPNDPVKFDFALFGLGVFEKYP